MRRHVKGILEKSNKKNTKKKKVTEVTMTVVTFGGILLLFEPKL